MRTGVIPIKERNQGLIPGRFRRDLQVIEEVDMVRLQEAVNLHDLMNLLKGPEITAHQVGAIQGNTEEVRHQDQLLRVGLIAVLRDREAPVHRGVIARLQGQGVPVHRGVIVRLQGQGVPVHRGVIVHLRDREAPALQEALALHRDRVHLREALAVHRGAVLHRGQVVVEAVQVVEDREDKI